MTETLPKNLDAEKYVIGCLIQFPDSANDIFGRLTPTDFFIPEHVKIFRAAQQQFAAGGIDRVLLGNETGHSDILYDCGVDPHNAPATAVHIPTEAGKIIECRKKRQLFQVADDARHAALNGHSFDGALRSLTADLHDMERESEATSESKIVTLADLRRKHPRLHPPVLDGLLRQGETCNIIAHSKAGKSWLGYGLALSVVSGQDWLGQFATSRGKVLLVDNELHASVLANRIPAVAGEMHIPPDQYEDDLEVWALRGNLRSLADLASDFEGIEPGTYRLILLDALYRFNIAGVSENDNAAMAAMYNTLDQLAAQTRAAIVLIHHASKGDQSGKRITDVGAGAGAQSRAADCHLILREHEERGVVVLEAAVRSFAPVEPLALEWRFPIWVPIAGVDTAKLKGRQAVNELRQGERDNEGVEAIVEALRQGPATPRQLRPKTGLSRERQQRLLDRLESKGQVTAVEVTIRGNVTSEYRLAKATD